ncbi:fibrinolytic enzyme, isozyme C-like [Liolophura sinensis]|uniref:fibrinolytic enzyme, isozyme C-like n=1 Tax=Liolophura sinensis TaxID=3198878 RepID=UPI0031593144
MWSLVSLFSLTGFALCGAFHDPTPSGNSNARIVGGTPADVGAYPWQLSLELRQLGLFWSHICGAVLINQNTALTAAHCVERQSTSNLRVIAGVTDRSSSSNKQTIYVSSVTMHPGWDTNGAGYPNDIAILKLQSNANEGSEFINSIPLAPADKTFEGYVCTLTGWGRTSGGGSLANWLQQVSMTVISNSQCASMWQTVTGAAINDGHICIYEESKSACNGDSGGPMVCQYGGVTYLAGITSWGVSTCSGEYPSVYTRVTYFLDWVNTNI